MGKLQKDQKGFSAVEVVLILVIVALIGVVGFMVHKNQSKSAASNNSSSSSIKKTDNVAKNTAAMQPAQPATSYFTIKEWGVRAPYSGNLTLVYSVDKDNTNDAWLGSQQLAVADPIHCSLSVTGGNAGYVGRYLPTDDIPTTGPDETAQDFLGQDFKASNSNLPSYAKVGNYYYIYWTGQSACSNESFAQSVENQTITDLGNVVKSLQAIPN